MRTTAAIGFACVATMIGCGSSESTGTQPGGGGPGGTAGQGATGGSGGTPATGGSGGSAVGGTGGSAEGGSGGTGQGGTAGTGEGGSGGTVLPSGEYVAFAFNDLGMHCLNPTYDTAVILPPYNTVWSQVVSRGSPPSVVTQNLTVEYGIVNNTYSYGKRQYGGFWDYCQDLFGVTLEHDTGLNLSDPSRHNGLSGTMVAEDGHFAVHGIPVVPVDDSNVWNPYQVANITVRDGSGATVAQTQATVPTSDEIHCAKCHEGDAFRNILEEHDEEEGTNLLASTPVLCAECHGSPALGTTGPGSSGRYLSQAVHGFHASEGATCYDCHPGATTQCSRSLAHTGSGGGCTNCHGSLAEVASSIGAGRTPWAEEPKCVTCHAGVAEVDTGNTLYRNAVGHGGLSCASCHGSPHAMVPSREATDNYQAMQLQGKAVPIGSCRACHENSRGGGDGEPGEFAQVHGGASPGVRSACSVCHTVVPENTAQWPHQFQWKSR